MSGIDQPGVIDRFIAYRPEVQVLLPLSVNEMGREKSDNELEKLAKRSDPEAGKEVNELSKEDRERFNQILKQKLKDKHL